ncbi:MAG TPA: tail fiber domain-containing protein, partial [Cytophagales bacterium]
VNRKENFRPVNGEALLGKIGGFRLTTWNYKGEDARRFRHYGPMAQDFYAAFGHDGVGTVGTDTTIATLDLNGLNFTAIKALVDRTDALRQKDAELEQKNRELEALLSQLKAQQEANAQLRSQLAGQQAELSAQQARSDQLENDLEAIKKHLGMGTGKETGGRETADRRPGTTPGGDAVQTGSQQAVRN